MNDHFDIIFADETPDDFFKPYYSWKILVVDDEKDVHAVTHLAFESVTFEGEYLKLLDAYSANEARQILRTNSDIAMVLLDVVMESDVAGLELVNYIREDLGNPAMRIVLRTGYPGKAPEKEVITNYDINDYRVKTDLTSDKIFSLVTSGLRSHRTIHSLQRNTDNLKHEIEELKLVGNMSEQTDDVCEPCFNTLPDLIDVIDKESRLHRVNKAMAIQLGLFPDEVAGITRCQSSDKKNSPIDILAIVSETIKHLRFFLPGIIEIDQNNYKHQATILGDITQIQQLVFHLFTNAYHAMGEDGGRLDINVESIRIFSDDDLIKHGFQPKEYIRLSVSATGLGMNPDTMQGINEPEVTTKRSESGNGAGGLSVVSRIVMNHGGQITVNSENGIRTTFHVYFPAQPPKDPAVI